MAFLLPENIPSRSNIPERLRQAARALRDFAPDEVTVWLRETMGGLPYLVVLDPSAGIMVVDAPSLSAAARRRRHQGRVFDSFDAVSIPSDELSAQAAELHRIVDVSSVDDLPVACVLAFPDLDEVPLERLGEADRALPILTRSDLSHDQLEGALHRVMGGERIRPLSDQEEKRARAVVNPEIKLPRPSTASLPLFQEPEIPPEDVIRVMDRRQERVAEHLGDGYRVLRGVAGSGKTLVLAHRARHLHKHLPEWRILMLCFNRVLANALKTMVDADDRLEVANIDRLAYDLAERRGGRPGPDRSTHHVSEWSSTGRDDIFDRRVLRATEVARTLPESQRFDLVLVDEAQDFDHSRLDLAYAMLKADRVRPDTARPDRDNFVMAYDVAQNVYRRGGARWNPPGEDAQGRARTARGRSTVFRKNYRNTREILEFAMNFLAESRDWNSAAVDLEDPAALIPPHAAKRSGPSPHPENCRNLRAEADRIARRVCEMLNEGAAAHDIAVLYGYSDLEKELRREFAYRGLPYFHVQRKDYPSRRDNRDEAVHVRDKVRVSTLTGVKGLEFSRVLIGGVNDIHVPDVERDEQHQAAKSQLYAAMTRAMDELEITMSGSGEIGAALRKAERLQRVG